MMLSILLRLMTPSSVPQVSAVLLILQNLAAKPSECGGCKEPRTLELLSAYLDHTCHGALD